jgi:putative 4-mercaptohistidine N1-methyltranferase
MHTAAMGLRRAAVAVVRSAAAHHHRLATRARSTTSSGSGVAGTALAGADVYETPVATNEYLQFHYATDADLCPFVDPAAGMDPTHAAALGQLMSFPVVCAQKLAEAGGRTGSSSSSSPRTSGRALDVGCSVGRTAFELARYYGEVAGLDFSNAFVDTANQLKANGELPYSRIVSGDVVERKVAAVPADLDRTRVTFHQGDACALDLKQLGGPFDGVVAANLLCRLPEPLAFLKSMEHVVVPGGSLVLISPYSWLEEYTPREKWIGWPKGSKGAAGEQLDSFGVVREVLENAGFTLQQRTNLPFVMREHRRKYQLGISECTSWRRRV